MEANEVIVAAQRLNEQKDEVALELLIGMRAAAIERDHNLTNDIYFEPKYDTQTMGQIEDIKRLSTRVIKRWNKELHDIVCGQDSQDTEERKEVLQSLGLGEAAVIAAVVSVLLSFGVGAALAAPLAPLIVRKFIWPAKDELCASWSEAIAAQS